jgi:hypothetical protein
VNTGAIPIYGGSPLSGRRDPGLFAIWRQWLKDLGGSYEPMRDLSERKPGGRRDPDRKPRRYELGEKYAIKSNGQVVRL